MDYVRPCNTNNAIKIVVFACEFSENFSPDDIKEIVENIETSNLFSKVLPSKKLRAKLVPDDFKEVQFKNYENEHEEDDWTITFRTNFISVNCTKYDTWSETISKVSLFFEYFSSIFKQKIIENVVLEYLNEFHIEQDQNWKNSLFNTSSQYLPSNIFELNDFWHSYNGFKSPISEENPNVVLNKINIEYLLNDDSHSVFIQLQHRTYIEEPSQFINFYENKLFNKVFEQSHDTNKTILSDILSNNLVTEMKIIG